MERVSVAMSSRDETSKQSEEREPVLAGNAQCPGSPKMDWSVAVWVVLCPGGCLVSVLKLTGLVRF